MLSLLRSRAAASGPVSYAVRVRHTARVSTAAFRPSRIAHEDADPSPNKARRGGSEQSMAGEADGDEIANSDGAYDSGTPRPQDSGKKIEGEGDANMSRTAASSEPAKHATDGESKQTDSQAKGGSKPGASGGTSVRGGNAN